MRARTAATERRSRRGSRRLALLPRRRRAALFPHNGTAGLETLWSIAAANNFTTRTIAAFNGVPVDARCSSVRRSDPDRGGGRGRAGARARSGEPEVPSPPPEPAPGAGLPSDAVPIHHPSSRPYPPRRRGRRMAGDARGVGAQAGRGPLSRRAGVCVSAAAEQQRHFWRLFQSGQESGRVRRELATRARNAAVDVATLEMRRAIDRLARPLGWRKVEAPSEWWHVNYVGG